MTQEIRVLHITAHLGGGVGKALSGLTQISPGISHSIACLERPEKLQFVVQIEQSGTEVILAPSQQQLGHLIEDADIVQVEWWGHPAVMAALCGSSLPAMRLLLWCHVSGLHTPVIPQALITIAHKCLFTSPCSLETNEVQNLSSEEKNRLGVVHSAGGIDELPQPVRSIEEPLTAGYLGSLNFTKLHPDYVDFLAHVPLSDFRVRMIGDETNRDILESQCRQAGCEGMLEFRGYCHDIVSELKGINVMPYILNPTHYGTTENALLEAMAMGVVPVVLDNPAEKSLIEHNQTGLIVQNTEEFEQAICWLYNHPLERIRISKIASEFVRKKFPGKSMQKTFASCYEELLSQTKSLIPFRDILGNEPAHWFLGLQREAAFFDVRKGTLQRPDNFARHGLLEQNKGSVFHYARSFPQDETLKKWKEQVTQLKNSLKMGLRTSL